MLSIFSANIKTQNQKSVTLKENVTSQYQIAVFVGSLRRDLLNRKLANDIVKLAPSDFTLKTSADRRLAALQPQDDDAARQRKS